MAYLHINKTKLVNLEYALKKELIRTNRAGSYACTTIIDCNTRKYHGLLICPLPDLDGGRHILLSGLDETIIQHNKEFNLGIHKYAGDIFDPKGHKYIQDFSSSPIPRLEYRIGGVIFLKEKILVKNESQILIKYTLIEAKSETKLKFKPFLAFRNIHCLSKANLDINTKYKAISNGICSNLYPGYPNLYMQLSKKTEFIPAPDWYYNIEYLEDQKRGYEYKEDLYVPGYFEVPIKKGESVIFSASTKKNNPATLKRKFNSEIKKRIPRDNFNKCLANTIQQFFIINKDKVDIIAGYPWLPIRSRDALIALPGLTLPFNDKKIYIKALKTIASRFDKHMLSEIADDPQSGYPIDNSLWFIWAVQQFGFRYSDKSIWKLFGATIKTIISGFFNETENFTIMQNGLLYIYNNKHCNSWMNALVENKPVIKRDGYLVELNALWYNALCYVQKFQTSFKSKSLCDKIESTIQNIKITYTKVFWNERLGILNDFVNEDITNNQIRPNMIFAASLPYSALTKEQIMSITKIIKSQLLTPYGIRSLNPMDSNYIATYKGDHAQREKAAFNGSVWPWLLTAYFEALLKVEPKSVVSNAERYMENFEKELQNKGICSISELYHGNPSQKAKGAISFAMNTGELIRLKNIIENFQ